MAEQPYKAQPGDSSLPEVPKLFSPGELAPSEGQKNEYGFRNEFLPQRYQNVLKRMVQKIAQIDLFSRIEEVKRATEGRFYWRSMFDVYFDERAALWNSPSGNINPAGDAGDTELSFGFNLYQAFGRGFITLAGVTPSVKFIAVDPSSPDASRIASSADAVKKRIEYQNSVDVLSEQVARLMWTDGRVGLYSRWVTDGSRFGYEDQDRVEETPEGLGEGGEPPGKRPRKPKGGVVISAYGVLECKDPINMRDFHEFPFHQLSYEIDLTAAKGMYPWISSVISGGQPGPGEYNFDRTSRIATTQGIRLLTQTGDTVSALPTFQRTWIRPSFYASINDDDDRKFFESAYPDGVAVAFIGDTYAESRNESMDDHWTVIHPIPGDGQAAPAAGYIVMPVQDAFNDTTDLVMESHMKAIPCVYGDKSLFDFAAISKQKAGPGAHWPTKREMEPTEDINHKMFTEPAVELPASVTAFYQALMGDIPQFLTGLYPASMGDADPSNQTKGGILALRDASRGQAGVAWKAYRKGYAGSMAQSVRIDAYFSQGEAEDGKIRVSSPGNPETTVDLEDLREGSFFCVPDGDESYPRTHEDRQMSYNSLVQAAATGNAGAAAILTEPKNANVLKDILALPGLVIPGAAESEKQMSEIQRLLSDGTPIPNNQAMQAYQLITLVAQATGKPAPPRPSMQALYSPSVPIDADFDVHAVEYRTVQDWLNDKAGQQVAHDDPDAFMNVRLHGLLHKAEMDKAQQSQVQAAVMPQIALEKIKHPQVPPRQVSESMAFKDLGPSGKLQVGKQAGLDLSADVSADMASETINPNPQRQLVRRQ